MQCFFGQSILEVLEPSLGLDLIDSNYFLPSKFMETMAGLVGSGGPPALIAFPCLLIYIKLMKQITSRPVANGLDTDKEKVIHETIAQLQRRILYMKDVNRMQCLTLIGFLYRFIAQLTKFHIFV